MIKTLKAAAAALALTGAGLGVSPALADSHAWKPNGPIKLIIAFRAGGGADTQSRLIAEELEARHGWKIIPEQVTGKGGVNAVMALQDQPADGTAMAMIVTESVGYNLRSAKAGDPSMITPITTTAGFQMGIVAMTSSGFKTLEDVVAAAQGGQKIRFGAMSPRLADLAYLLGQKLDVDFNIISVKGGKAVMNGLNAGDFDIGFGAGIQTKAVLAGDMVNLASAMDKPLSASPDAPLMSAYGMEFGGDGYFMLAGPGGMDPKARDAIAAAVQEIILDDGTKAAGVINKAFGGPVAIAGEELDAFVQGEFDDAAVLMEATK